MGIVHSCEQELTIQVLHQASRNFGEFNPDFMAPLKRYSLLGLTIGYSSRWFDSGAIASSLVRCHFQKGIRGKRGLYTLRRPPELLSGKWLSYHSCARLSAALWASQIVMDGIMFLD
jgi:hypothetical protein